MINSTSFRILNCNERGARMISINRNLDVLIEECSKLNLHPTPTKTNKKGKLLTPFDVEGKTVSKEDCVRCLQEYFVGVYKNEGRYTQALDWMLKTEFQPMLANQLSNCKWKDDIYKRDDEVIAETKIDGNRSLWCKFGDEGLQMFSRNLSVLDFLPVNYTKKIVNEIDVTKLSHNFVIDGEIVISRVPADDILMGFGLQPGTTQLNLTTALLESDKQETLDFQTHYPLKLMVFDIIWFDGEDLTNRPLSERLKYLDVVYKEMVEAGANIERPLNNKDLGLSVEDFHKKMLMNNEEGSIVKLLNSTYFMNGNRSHDAWVKLKRTATSSLVEANLGDTIDGFVTGFSNVKDSNTNSWRIGALEFSVYLINDDIFSADFGKEPTIKVIANVGGLTEEFARSISEPDPDNPGYCRLKKEAYGLVAELTGQDFSPRSQTLMHPRIVRMRTDKPMSQCTLSKNFIETQIM